MADNPRLEPREAQFESLLADVFQRAGWKVQRGTRARNREIDLLIARPPYQYAVELKVASDAPLAGSEPALAQGPAHAVDSASRS